jgi:acetylornithine deacetylase/succinyl-diaminopimelate desuccinylase-like protein
MIEAIRLHAGVILEANAHAADEHLRLTDLQAATEVVALALADLLKA